MAHYICAFHRKSEVYFILGTVTRPRAVLLVNVMKIVDAALHCMILFVSTVYSILLRVTLDVASQRR